MFKNRIFSSITVFFALIGVLFSVWFIAGFAQGLSQADLTEGGYEYPYAGWTGTPTDYGAWYVTDNGFYQPGWVVDQSLECETGQLRFHFLGIMTFDFRAFSDRAKVVHQPQVACRELGYDTSTWDSINDPDGLFTDLAG